MNPESSSLIEHWASLYPDAAPLKDETFASNLLNVYTLDFIKALSSNELNILYRLYSKKITPDTFAQVSIRSVTDLTGLCLVQEIFFENATLVTMH